MLRIVCSASSGAAKAYYTGSFTRGDYYCAEQEQELVGNWHGRGAKLLGLSGAVEREAFLALCDNINPIAQEQLTQRTKTNRRVGFDLTFDVPKSVSVLYGVTGDQRIMKAFRQSVQETMDELEQRVQTRVRLDGQRDTDRTTGNVISAEFIHLTARPVDGYPDPQLHAHTYVFNATFDEVERRWKALQLGQVVEDAPYYQSVFHSRMVGALQELGYSITRKGLAFEVDGVPESVIAMFSRRTGVIEALAAERGITDADAKAKLGALTREHKAKELTLGELKEIWTSRLTLEERRVLEQVAERARSGREQSEQLVRVGVRGDVLLSTSEQRPLTPEQRAAVEQAMLHCFATESVVTDRCFKGAVLRFGVSDIRYGELEGVLAQVPELVRRDVNGRSLVTTQQVLEEERSLVSWVRSGKRALPPLAQGHVVADRRLGEDQRAAVRHVLESTDRVTGIEGRAGTGKTTLMTEAIAAMEARGERVMVLAPTAVVARELLRKAGFSQANTVEKWLRDEELQKNIGRGAVWWVDEAGLLSVPSMARLARLAEQHDARIILGGDTRQHRAVERGDALLMLKEHADLSLAVVDTVRRQQGPYKEAVEEFSNARLAEGFEKLDAMGALHEIPMEDLHKRLAREYMRVLEKGDKPLVVSPTHFEIRKVTAAIREELMAAGRIKDEEPIEVLRPVNMSPAEKKDLRSFRPGQVLEMMEAAPGFKVGDRLTLVSKGPEVMRVQMQDGQYRNVEPSLISDRFEVYQPETITIAEGDQILITKNGRSVSNKQPLHNGTLDTVIGFTVAGDLKLAGGAVLDRKFKHWTWGYATTSHVSQGKTVDTVLVAESSDSFVAASREQFYVSVSRGMKALHVYTDDRDELLHAVHRSSQRMAAIELDGVAVPERTEETERTRDRLGTVSPKAPEAEQVIEREDPHAKAVEREPSAEAMPVRYLLGEIPSNVQIVNVRGAPVKPKLTLVQEPPKLTQQLGELERVEQLEHLKVVKPPERKTPERDIGREPELEMGM